MKQCTDMRLASFLSGGFITAILVNLPEKKQAKRTSVQCGKQLESEIFENILLEN